MEEAIKILIYIHAGFGVIALLSGLMAIIARKGKRTHKKSGLFFYYSMMLSGVTAMIIAVLPKHENPFLFAIGIFSLYFVISGYRALNFKNKEPNLTIDKWVSIIMIVTGVLMIFLPIVLTQSINIILTVFAITGMVLAVRDLILYKNAMLLRKSWLKLHLGKMLGGYISATTAFVIVNDFFPSIYGWFIPGIIGSFVIAYWIRKTNRKSIPKNLVM